MYPDRVYNNIFEYSLLLRQRILSLCLDIFKVQTCFSDSTANIVQRQICIATVFLSKMSEDVIMVFQSCLAARAEPDRGIGGLSELEFLVGQSWMNLIRWKREAPLRNLQVAFMTVPVDTGPR